MCYICCIMRRLFSIMLLLILVAPTVMNSIALTDYAVKYDYYANVLCENKDQPESHCNGACQLALALEVPAQQEPDSPTILLLKEFEVPTCEADDLTLLSIWNYSPISRYTALEQNAYPSCIDPPPRV